MPTCKLTQTNIDRAQPADGKQKLDLFDTELPGLLLKVLSSGYKAYYTRSRSSDGKMHELKLADARLVSLHQARKLARERLCQKDQDKKQQRAPTLEEFAQEQYLPYVRSYKNSVETDKILLRKHLLPRFGAKRMDQINRLAIQRYVQELTETYRPSSVNRVLILLRFIYNLALRWEVPGLTANPTHGIDQLKEHNKRERFLSAEELQRLFTALDTPNNRYLKAIVTMLALTGA
ncbi:integrase family protein, partial [Halorhodospira halochloris]|uniref:integrase family protein n=1 Tax=Halorhodospira halochloris TaxID=1052 RepID=UPI001EE7B3A2